MTTPDRVRRLVLRGNGTRAATASPRARSRRVAGGAARPRPKPLPQPLPVLPRQLPAVELHHRGGGGQELRPCLPAGQRAAADPQLAGDLLVGPRPRAAQRRRPADLLPEDDPGPPVVIATPSRRLPRPTLVEFGVAVAEAATRAGRRAAFVASCDWSHTHAGGRYGVHPAAAEVDAVVVRALQDNAPGRLIELDERQVEAAAIDGLWQALMLAGVMRHTPLRGEVLSYEAPPAYATGMIVATFEPA